MKTMSNNSRPVVFGFTGEMGVGKSTIVEYLVKKYGGTGPHNVVAVRFAAPLYRATEAWYTALNMPFKKETARGLLQFGGTEWGRGQHGEDFWVQKWREEAARHLLLRRIVLVEDVRFDNEAEAIHKMGGRVIKVVAKTTKRKNVARNGIKGHASEAGIKEELVDFTLDNNTTVNDLYKKLDLLWEDWEAGWI